MPSLVYENENTLDTALSTPSEGLVEMFKRVGGDIIILGVAGKMGVTLAAMAKKASDKAGSKRKIIGAARFSDPDARKKLEESGVETIQCDLLDRKAVDALPDAPNIIYMAGRKFGTCGEEALTWAMNVIAPENTANRFKDSKTVVFSTGCVYPLVTAESGGCDETVTPVPVGEYAQSCLGRERVFEFHAKTRGLKVLLLRLNYAIDPRYGVLHDIASNVMAGHPVSLSAPCFNCLWQRDANDWALRSLELCASPAAVLNITGPETLPVKETAEKFAEFFGKKALFSAEPGGRCYLSSAAKAVKLFGYPGAGPADMLESQAEWLLRGGRSLGKPTHFETTNGKF